MKYTSKFPPNLMDQAIDLQIVNVKELGWLKDIALEVILVCQNQDLAILGGDILVIKDDNTIEYTLDNWYINRRVNQSWSEYVKASCNYAVDRIRFYSSHSPNKKLVFTLIISSERDYPE